MNDNLLRILSLLPHSKNAGLFQPKFGSNMDKPKCWVKNAIKNVQLKVKVEFVFRFEITVLIQNLGLSILPKFGLEQPSIV